MSRQLAPCCKSILGVDISQGMVDQYNTRVHNQGIPPEDMRALCIELKGEEGELDGLKFDVVLASNSPKFHSGKHEIIRESLCSVPWRTTICLSPRKRRSV